MSIQRRSVLIYFAAILGAAVFLFVSFGVQPANAELKKKTIVPCRDANLTCWPESFAFTPSGKIFYAERYTGQIRVYNPETGMDKKWFKLPGLAKGGGQGVVGLTRDPDWPQKKWIYVKYSYKEPLQNRIIRLRKKKNGDIVQQILLRLPASTSQNGGAIHIGPDKNLYVATGDAKDPSLAQDLDSRAGKILRLKRNGSIPNNNPFEDSYVFSYGHRNAVGFAFDHQDRSPENVEAWVAEVGPDCNDEINFVKKGKNYGWGSASTTCPNTNISGTDSARAKYTWSTSVKPSGAAFCKKCKLGKDINGRLIIGDSENGQLYHVKLNRKRRKVKNVRKLYRNDHPVLAIERGIDSLLYFSDQKAIYLLYQE